MDCSGPASPCATDRGLRRLRVPVAYGIACVASGSIAWPADPERQAVPVAHRPPRDRRAGQRVAAVRHAARSNRAEAEDWVTTFRGQAGRLRTDVLRRDIENVLLADYPGPRSPTAPPSRERLRACRSGRAGVNSPSTAPTSSPRRCALEHRLRTPEAARQARDRLAANFDRAGEAPRRARCSPSMIRLPRSSPTNRPCSPHARRRRKDPPRHPLRHHRRLPRPAGPARLDHLRLRTPGAAPPQPELRDRGDRAIARDRAARARTDPAARRFAAPASQQHRLRGLWRGRGGTHWPRLLGDGAWQDPTASVSPTSPCARADHELVQPGGADGGAPRWSMRDAFRCRTATRRACC